MRIIDGKSYDIVVCGCGSAGFIAAVQAGRAGMRTAVIEREGMPGGIMTVGGNNDIAQFFAHHRQVIRGIGYEFVERLASEGMAVIPDMMADGPHWIYGVHVNIPAAAHMMDVMLTEAGVDIYYEQPIVEVETAPSGDPNHPRRLNSVILSTKAGLKRVTAQMFIDATGDGDTAVWAGAEFQCGDPDNPAGFLQPGTIRAYPDPTASSPEKEEALRSAFTDGSIHRADLIQGSIRGYTGARGNNTNHVSGFNGADSDSKTAANIEGRSLVHRLQSNLKGHGINIETISSSTAMRETRRIVCDTVITAEDYVSAREYPDSICTSFYPIDLHRDGMGGIQQVFLTEGQVPRIPLSALTVKGLTNLYVAGRCASGDRLANSAYRVKASCMAMGQAAAAAAVIAIRENHGNSRGCDLEHIKELLRLHNAIVP